MVRQLPGCSNGLSGLVIVASAPYYSFVAASNVTSSQVAGGHGRCQIADSKHQPYAEDRMDGATPLPPKQKGRDKWGHPSVSQSSEYRVGTISLQLPSAARTLPSWQRALEAQHRLLKSEGDVVVSPDPWERNSHLAEAAQRAVSTLTPGRASSRQLAGRGLHGSS